MNKDKHRVAFELLDDDNAESFYEYKILLFLNKPKSKNQLETLHKKVDLTVFSNGCWKEIFDEFGYGIVPSCIIGDTSSLSKETKSMCEKHQIQIISKSGEEKTDLEKSLYYCFEKIAKVECSPILKSKGYNYPSIKSAIIVYFDSETGFDYILSIYSEVSKYNESEDIDIIMLSSQNMSIYLKEGTNIISSSLSFMPKKSGFTVASFNRARCKIYELDDEESEDSPTFLADKVIKFGDSFYSRKTSMPKTIKIEMFSLGSTSSAIFFSSIQLPE